MHGLLRLGKHLSSEGFSFIEVSPSSISHLFCTFCSVLSSGRKWVSRSVSSLEVQGAVVGLAKQEVPSTLFQELSSSPELIVLFLEPNVRGRMNWKALLSFPLDCG